MLIEWLLLLLDLLKQQSRVCLGLKDYFQLTSKQ
jgi:hypothetical protein